MTLRPQPEKLSCLQTPCDAKDAGTCCLDGHIPPTAAPGPAPAKAANCAGYKCPAAMTLRPHPENIRCYKASGCTGMDTGTCCLAPSAPSSSPEPPKSSPEPPAPTTAALEKVNPCEP